MDSRASETPDAMLPLSPFMASFTSYDLLSAPSMILNQTLSGL